MSFANFANVMKHPAMRPLIIGGGVGAASGAALGGLPKYRTDYETGKRHKRSKLERVGMGALNAVTMGGLGASLGARYSMHKNFSPGGRYAAGYAAHADPGARSAVPRHSDPIPTQFRGIKTKADAAKLKKQFAAKNHPDVGGDEKKFKNWMEQFQHFEKHEKFPKHAMVTALFDELQKIGW